MMRRIRGRLSFANVVASVALFVALGGTSYAAVTITGRDIADGSVQSRDVENDTLRGRDVASNTIGTDEISNGSLTKQDFRSGQLPAGPKGDTGPAGSASRFLLLDENGNIEEQSGGFTVKSKAGINGQPATNPNVYVDTGATLVGHGLTATIAIQNRLDRTGDMVADPAFTGDAAVARCNTAAVACAPVGTNTDNTLVVRALADNTNVAAQTRRVYVVVTP